MALDTIEFMPWISDTTVTIDVTATMLPSTVMNDRSLLAQMACSAIATDSRIWFIAEDFGLRSAVFGGFSLRSSVRRDQLVATADRRP